jgi:putative nucleotidyltransferase with HDIG domain
VGIYLLFSFLWILLSDRLISIFTQDPLALTRIQTFKGLFFVISSGLLIFLLLRAELKKRELAWQTHQAERETLIKRIQLNNVEIQQAHDAAIEGWARTLELRDRETAGHSDRVLHLTLRLSRAMGITGEELQHIRWGALLHDIGKLGIPDQILLKPGPLDAEEREIVRRHPEQGYQLLKDIDYLEPILDIPHYHHERWDGDGYPCGLRGEQIPLTARIFAIVDVWDAMTSDRPYRPGIPYAVTITHIKEQSGKHFDPAVVEHFLAMMEDLRHDPIHQHCD